MRNVFTQAALQGKSLPELRALFASVQQDLVRSDAGSQERTDALTSLETISRTIATRMSAGPRF